MAESAGPPIVRYLAGCHAARGMLEVQDAMTLSQALAAVVDGDDDGARDLLAGLPADVVDRLGAAAGKVREIAEQVNRGRRS